MRDSNPPKSTTSAPEYRWLKIRYPDGRVETVTNDPSVGADRHFRRIDLKPDGSYTLVPVYGGECTLCAGGWVDEGSVCDDWPCPVCDYHNGPEEIPRDWLVSTPWLV